MPPVFTQLASSTFPGADEIPLSEGGNWNIGTGALSFRLFSHAATAQSGNDNMSLYIGIAAQTNSYSRGNLFNTGSSGNDSGIGLLLRGANTGSQAFVRFIINHNGANNASLDRLAAGGTYTNLVLWTQPYTDGDQFTFAIENQVLYVYDKTLALVQTYDDSGGPTPALGYIGLSSSTPFSVTGTNVTNWSGGTFQSQASNPGPGRTPYIRMVR